MGETRHQHDITVLKWAAEVFSIIKIVLEKRIFESYNMIDLYHHIQAMDQIWVINLKKNCIGLLGKKKKIKIVFDGE